jgi:hypothetical protein
MPTLSPHKVGLVLGGVVAAFHLLWSVVVALGFAQGAINWIFRLHFIQPPFTVSPFSLKLAVGLIVLTFVVGYVFGWVLGAVWNSLHKA